MQFALGVIIALLALLVNYVFKSEEIANALQAYATPIVTLAATWWLALLILLFSRRPISNLWRRGEFHVSILPLVILLILGTSILESEIDNVTRHFFPMPEFIAEIMENVNITPFSGMLLLVFVAPFGEEVFFRGVILDGFLKRYSTKTALIASSLIFALAHMNPYQFFSAFCAGLVTGVIYIKTRSLWPCVFAHGLNNLLVWAIMNKLHTLIPLDIPGYTSGGYGEKASFHPWWFDVLGVALTMATTWALAVYFKKRRALSEQREEAAATNTRSNGKGDIYVG
jgi:membrane protease YdiL (CAAX protease family)